MVQQVQRYIQRYHVIVSLDCHVNLAVTSPTFSSVADTASFGRNQNQRSPTNEFDPGDNLADGSLYTEGQRARFRLLRRLYLLHVALKFIFDLTSVSTKIKTRKQRAEKGGFHSCPGSSP